MPRFIFIIMENLRITTIQSILHWKNIEANLTMFGEKLDGLTGQTDLVILPEMFTTGFSMEPADVAEKMDGRSMLWMREKAKEINAVVTGSLILEEHGNFYNRVIWMRSDGTYEQYDKRHLFSLAGEHEIFTAGNKRLVTEWKGWKVCPLVCYDLRFPAWSRNSEDYDLLIYMANWPEKRSHHWHSLLMARAIENQCFTIGVNRIGSDEMGLSYLGGTSVIDYSGQLILPNFDGRGHLFLRDFQTTHVGLPGQIEFPARSR